MLSTATGNNSALLLRNLSFKAKLKKSSNHIDLTNINLVKDLTLQQQHQSQLLLMRRGIMRKYYLVRAETPPQGIQ